MGFDGIPIEFLKLTEGEAVNVLVIFYCTISVTGIFPKQGLLFTFVRMVKTMLNSAQITELLHYDSHIKSNFKDYLQTNMQEIGP